jgi:uncharacterized protein (TIGR00369 family)
MNPVDSPHAPPPDGFEPMPPFGPFHELVGPMYVKTRAEGSITGMRMQEKHRNLGEMMHGGMLCMLIDTAFTWGCKHARTPTLRVLTTQLSVNLIGNAVPGDWIEARVKILRAGRRVVFAECRVRVQARCIAQASGQFQVMGEHPVS